MTVFVRWIEHFMGANESIESYDPLGGDVELGQGNAHPYISMDTGDYDDDPDYICGYYTDFYNDARKYKYGETADDGKPLQTPDFCYQMIAVKTQDDLEGWWMLSDHPICEIIIATARSPDPTENGRWRPLTVNNTVFGVFVAYSDQQVAECIDYAMRQCKNFGLEVEVEIEQEQDQDQEITTNGVISLTTVPAQGTQRTQGTQQYNSPPPIQKCVVKVHSETNGIIKKKSN